MSIEAWLAFTAAAAIILVIPGPTILLVVSYALGHGRKTSVVTAAGVALGDFTAMTASMLGLGALLATSATIFTILKWIGGAYLVYLGVKLWRAPVFPDAAAPAPAERPWRVFLHLYTVTALNPKTIVFFVAFLPQFFDPARPLLPQAALAEATFLALAVLNAAAYARLARLAGGTLRRPALKRLANRLGGGLLMCAGLAALPWRRGVA